MTDAITVTLPRHVAGLTRDLWHTALNGTADDIFDGIDNLEEDEVSAIEATVRDLDRALGETPAATTAVALTPRGFGEYGTVTDSRDNVVTVRQSSAVGGPYVYVFTRNAAGDRAIMHMGEPHAIAPHLNVAQARALIEALQRFVDDEAHAAARAP